MIICLPVVDNHELTYECLRHLADTVVRDDTRIVVYDNGSEEPYTLKELKRVALGLRIDLMRDKKNIGYYLPLQRVTKQYKSRPDSLLGLMHNDVMVYEEGFDQRLVDAFINDNKLDLVGFFGSNEIDNFGGRGAGSMGWFRGGITRVGNSNYEGQDQSAGARIADLRAAGCLDSLFMMFRRTAIDYLDIDEDITLAHFYDRIWPVKVLENNRRVAVLGVEIDHIGGLTTTGSNRYREDCIAWLEERDIPYENPETEMYLVAERRYLSEYRDQKRFIPLIVNGDYSVRHLSQ